MKVFISANKLGKPVSFEIDNTYLGRKGFVRVIQKIPGAVIIRGPKKLFSWFMEDEFCEFEVNGQRFIAEEPFGDNSHYWVATTPSARACSELEIVIDQFKLQKWSFGLGNS